jgi:hypothetical protein
VSGLARPAVVALILLLTAVLIQRFAEGILALAALRAAAITMTAVVVVARATVVADRRGAGLLAAGVILVVAALLGLAALERTRWPAARRLALLAALLVVARG